MSVFEAGMLVCFGLSWPVNIYKSIKSRTAAGRSVVFLYLIWVGYLSGIINKLLYNFDLIVWLYVLNLVMVSVDMVLYYRNRGLDRKRGRAEPVPNPEGVNSLS
jgi:hypothetical protein